MQPTEPEPFEPIEAEGRNSLRWILWLVVLLLAGGIAIAALTRGGSGAGDNVGTYANAFGGPFTLTAPDG